MERSCPSSETLVTPDSGVGSPPLATSCAPRSPRSPNLQRRDCHMHDGRPPHPYYVDPDTGMSYWEPMIPEVATPAAVVPPGKGARVPPGGAAAAPPSMAGAERTVAKPSTVGMWSPRGVVAAEGGVISMPLLAPTAANTGGGSESGTQKRAEQAAGAADGK